jgi:hypothetical protein
MRKIKSIIVVIIVITSTGLFYNFKVEDNNSNPIKRIEKGDDKKSCCSSIKKVKGGKCTGKSNCTACSNCSRCAHCSNGGTCGVCVGTSSGKSKSTYTYPNNSSSGKSSSGNYSGSSSNSSLPATPVYGTVGVYKVTAAELYLRESASTTSNKLMTLHKDDKVVMIEIFDANWMKVKVELLDGTSLTGYVYRIYIKAE